MFSRIQLFLSPSMCYTIILYLEAFSFIVIPLDWKREDVTSARMDTFSHKPAALQPNTRPVIEILVRLNAGENEEKEPSEKKRKQTPAVWSVDRPQTKQRISEQALKKSRTTSEKTTKQDDRITKKSNKTRLCERERRDSFFASPSNRFVFSFFLSYFIGLTSVYMKSRVFSFFLASLSLFFFIIFFHPLSPTPGRFIAVIESRLIYSQNDNGKKETSRDAEKQMLSLWLFSTTTPHRSRFIGFWKKRKKIPWIISTGKYGLVGLIVLLSVSFRSSGSHISGIQAAPTCYFITKKGKIWKKGDAA